QLPHAPPLRALPGPPTPRPRDGGRSTEAEAKPPGGADALTARHPPPSGTFSVATSGTFSIAIDAPLSHARRPPIFAPLRADPGIKPPVSRAHDDRGEVRPLSRWSQSPAAERGTAHGGALPDPGGRGLRQDEDVGPPDRPPDPREGG